MADLSFDDLSNYLLRQNGRILHQIWLGLIPNKRQARKDFKGLRRYRDSWLTKNPTWTYMCWNEKRCKQLMKGIFPEHLEMYNSYPYHIQRCDAVRYFILYYFGGVYADMDYYCNRPFDEVLAKYQNDIYLVETPNTIDKSETHVSNSLMFSKPGHVFWKKLFIELELHKTSPYYYSRHMVVMFTTGPGILNRVYNKYKYRYKLDHFPHKLFHPYGLSDDIVVTLNSRPEVYAVHLGKGSWESNDSKWIIFVYQEYTVILFIILVFVLPSLAYYLWKRYLKT